MGEGKKKLVGVIIIIVCLGAAGVITVMTGKKDSDNIKNTAKTVMFCRNDSCRAEYQVTEEEYRRRSSSNRDPTLLKVCKECGEQSVVPAVKCKGCGIVFFKGAVPHDFADRCPECKYSATEEARKARAEKERAKERLACFLSVCPAPLVSKILVPDGRKAVKPQKPL